jgi:hypothetical protein
VWDRIPNHIKEGCSSSINYFKVRALSTLSKTLAEMGHGDTAFKAIEKIMSTKEKRRGAGFLVLIFREQGKDEALEKAQKILEEHPEPPSEWD